MENTRSFKNPVFATFCTVFSRRILGSLIVLLTFDFNLNKPDHLPNLVFFCLELHKKTEEQIIIITSRGNLFDRTITPSSPPGLST